MNGRLLPLAGPLVFLSLWYAVSSAGIVSQVLLPSPDKVVSAGLNLLAKDDGLLVDIGFSLWRTLASFGLAVLTGVPVGLAMGASTHVYRMFSASVDFFRSIPPIALFPVFIMIFGISESSRIAVPYYGAFLVMVVNSAYGVTNMPKIRRAVGDVFKLGKMQSFFHIIMPSALPYIATGARIAISLSLVLVIVVEMTLSANRGLGRLIYDFHTIFESSSMYFVILVVGFLGYSLNRLFEVIENTCVYWRGE